MRIVADESVDQPIVERLRADGHEVVAMVDLGPGSADEEVLEVARQRDAVLLTADKDFGELVHRHRRLAAGVILVRLAGLSVERKQSVVSRTLAHHAPELAGAFTVLSPGMVRIRRLGP
jgi:predicted nuclease of predicted toxin-antitoxin system